MKKRTISLVKFFLGWPLSLIAIFFLVKFILSQTTHVAWSTFHPNGWVVFLSILSFAMYFLFRSIFWQELLKIQGHFLEFKETAYLWGISEIQRYIPGNIWSILGRTVSFEKKGVTKITTTKSWMYEAEFLCIASLVVSLLATNFIVYGLLPAFPDKWIVTLVITCLVWGGTILFLVNQRFTKNIPFIKHLLPGFTFSQNITLLLIMIFSMLFFGLGTYLSIVSFTPLYPYDFSTFIGFFTFAFVVGYLSFIFPMGLGPREALMTYGLSKFIPLPLAGLGAFFSRIVLIVAELLFLFVIFLWYKTTNNFVTKLTHFVIKHKYLLLTSFFVMMYVTYFITASILRYNNFFTGRFDLGNMDQTVWNTVHGRIFQLTDPDGTNIISRLSVHADFILVLLAPFYLLWQDPRMLLIIQTLVLAAGAFFVYFLGREITKNTLVGCVFAALFLLSPAIEYTNLYDFHGVTLATTFFLGAFYFLKRRNTPFTIIFLILAGTTKEEAWAVVAVFGLYAFFIEKRKVFGSILFVAGSILFYGMFKLIPIVKGGQHFAVEFYSDFGNSPSSILKTMILSPQKTLSTIFQKGKLIYLFELGFPLAFFSLGAPIFLIFMAPDLAVNLLSNSSPFHEIYYQYTAVLSAFIFIAAMYGFVRIQKTFPLLTTKTLLMVLVVTGILAAYNYGPLPISKKGNVDMFWLSQPNKAAINDFLNSIPRRYSIAATNNVGSHLSHRQLIYTIPTGIDKADILVFLLNDKYAQPSLPAQVEMTEKLRQDPRYVEAIHLGDFVVFEKKTIFPHMRATNRPNSLLPRIIQGLKQSFNGKGSTSTSKSS